MRPDFGKIFHEKSKDRGMGGLVNIPKDRNLWPPSWKIVVYKRYDRFPKIILPKATPRSFGHNDLIMRKSERVLGSSYTDIRSGISQKHYNPFSLSEISNMLYYSCGEVKDTTISNLACRIQASAGARYPIECYILNFEKGDLEQKCYHYNVQDHSLEELWDIPIRSRQDILTYFGETYCVDASMAIVLTGVVRRTTMKYGERGYRYMYLEAGAILNNIQNNALLEKRKSVVVGGINDMRVENLLDLDGENETIIIGVLLG